MSNMKKHKVVIEFEREDDMKWFIESIDEARKVYVQSGARVGGVFAGIILDRVGQSLGVHRLEVDPVVRDLAERLEAATDYMDCNDPAGAEDYASSKLAVDASGVTLPDQPPTAGVSDMVRERLARARSADHAGPLMDAIRADEAAERD